MQEKSPPLYFLRRWEEIPFLIHGFGTKYWDLSDFAKHPVYKNFQLLFLRQLHSDIIHVIEEFPRKPLAGDALITRHPGFLLLIKTADCLPVLMVSEEKKVVAAVHCGWKNTSRKLAQKVVQVLERSLECSPSSLSVGLGPCIGPDCYEVGEDVRELFKKRGSDSVGFRCHPVRKGKYFLDLKQVNKKQLIKAGIKPDNIFSVDICTHCEKNLLSYRRDKKTTARILSFIGLSF